MSYKKGKKVGEQELELLCTLENKIKEKK